MSWARLQRRCQGEPRAGGTPTTRATGTSTARVANDPPPGGTSTARVANDPPPPEQNREHIFEGSKEIREVNPVWHLPGALVAKEWANTTVCIDGVVTPFDGAQLHDCECKTLGLGAMSTTGIGMGGICENWLVRQVPAV